jgi:hypothetical protein
MKKYRERTTYGIASKDDDNIKADVGESGCECMCWEQYSVADLLNTVAILWIS